jgi:hypothetical protein
VNDILYWGKPEDHNKLKPKGKIKLDVTINGNLGHSFL